MHPLTRRGGLNLGLLILSSGLAALVWFAPGGQDTATVPPLLNLAPAQVARLRVERFGQDTLMFERHGELWRMTASGTGSANPVLMNPILNLAEARCPLRYPVVAVNLHALQLDPPRLRLWLNDREIHFGNTAPTDGRRYLRLADQVYLCPDLIYPLLTSSAAGFLAPVIESPNPK